MKSIWHLSERFRAFHAWITQAHKQPTSDLPTRESQSQLQALPLNLMIGLSCRYARRATRDSTI